MNQPSHRSASCCAHRAFVLALAVSTGCMGAATDAPAGPASGNPTPASPNQPAGSGSPSGSGGAGAVAPPTIPAAPGATAGQAPLRRLTAEQYRHTVRDLLGLPDAVAVAALPPDETIAAKFTSNVVRPVRAEDLDRYADAAGRIAAKAAANLGPLVPCPPANGDAACAAKFIETFGRRAYRRPLDRGEVDRLMKVFAAGGAFPNGIRLVLEAVLQSPKFLYLVEPMPAGKAGQIVALDDHALAARLSYFLWNSTPDDALLDAAGKGALGKGEGLVNEAKRLMADRRFADALDGFHLAWLELHDLTGAEKSPQLFPAWNPALKTAMAEETRRFVAHVLGPGGDGKLETLLSARWSFLAGPLYDLYGVPRPGGASEWQRVELPTGQRAGLLTQASLLSSLAREDRTSFVRRGKMVREAFFCQEIPPPPPGVNDSDAEIPASASAKERAEIHRKSPDCAACHAAFDPIGFAFEGYDAIGRFRASADGKPIETTLDLTNTTIDGRFAGIVPLAEKLSGAAEVRSCVARQWLRFALGRLESPGDQIAVDEAARELGASGDMRQMLIRLVAAAPFRHVALEGP